MCESERRHLTAFVSFIQAAAARLKGLQTKNWLMFARAYNGKNQVGYDTKMRDAYAALTVAKPPLSVKAAAPHRAHAAHRAAR
jgi:hypothetical protein